MTRKCACQVFALSVVVSFFTLASSAMAADFNMPDLAMAKTTAEIVGAVEKVALKDDDGKAYFSTTQYSGVYMKAFVVWYNPYSGMNANHVYIYVYDEKKEMWVRKVAKIVRSSVSVAFDSYRVTIRGPEGKPVLRYPVE